MNKYILKSVLALAVIASAASCDTLDYNDKYFGGDGYTTDPEITDIQSLSITLTDEDYASFSDLGGNNYFSAEFPIANYMPSYLASLYLTLDDGSSVKVTYNYQEEQPEYLSDLKDAADYTISDENYAAVWGDIEASYFTPTKKFASYAYKFLAAEFPDAVEGDIAVVEYNYSSTEPSTGGVSSQIVLTEIAEPFDYVATNYAYTEIEGWINYSEVGSSLWTDRIYSNNGYTQCSTYGTDASEVVSWLVSPLVDLSEATAPLLSFDICVGNANGAELQILISEDFNGSESGVASATWEDISANFSYESPSSGYGSMSPAGIADMSDYIGSKVYLAFKYIGDSANSMTTTFQIDNIELGDTSTLALTETYSEDFEDGLVWTSQTTKGTYSWSQATYNNNGYTNISAFEAKEDQEVYLISPAIPIAEGDKFSFDVLTAFNNGDGLSVLVSTDYVDDAATATWDDITSAFVIPTTPTSGYGSFATAGSYIMSDYEGESVYIAFKYEGGTTSGVTSTYRTDNVLVYSLSRVSAAALAPAATRAIDGVHSLNAIYTYNGSAWAAYEGAVSISDDQMAEMGLSTFSSSALPSAYIPTWLSTQYPYAVEGDTMGVVYDYSSARSSAEYIYSSGVWAENTAIVVNTDQFVKNNGEWLFDPNVTISIGTTDSDNIALYFPTMLNYVKSTYGEEYIDSYGTSEYYSGSASYYGNINWRYSYVLGYWEDAGIDITPYYAHTNGSDGLVAMYDVLKANLAETLAYALSVHNADANAIDGLEVLYTVKFGLYHGPSISGTNAEMVFEVVGPAEFEFKELNFLDTAADVYAEENLDYVITTYGTYYQ